MQGPFSNPRGQRSILPGVSGFRTYHLGTDSVRWTVRGILAATDLLSLENKLFTGCNYQDDALYDFTTSAGTVFPNCLLTQYGPASEVMGAWVMVGSSWIRGVIQYVQGQVEWAAPP